MKRSENMAKGQIDPGVCHIFASGQCMLPVLLGAASHQQETAVLQMQREFMRVIILAPQQKIPARAEADGCDQRLLAQAALIVAVPAHGIVAITVVIAQYTVERLLQFLLQQAPQCQQ